MNWKRLRTALNQASRQMEVDIDLMPAVLQAIESLIEKTGEATATRGATFRLGKVLLRSQLAPLIIAPCCPDYSYRDGVYTFGGLSGGVSLLTQQHIAFLDGILEALPSARVLFLLADQEAQDAELCRKCGVSPDQFRALLNDSLQATQAAIAGRGWQVAMMTDTVPGFYAQEAATIRRIEADLTLSHRLDSEAMQRAAMYRRINAGFSHNEMRERTIRTAAQYLVLAGFARDQQALLCNHTTTNLAWYADAQVAVLHNPVVVY